MNSSVLVLLTLSTATILFFTAVSILLLIFSSGTKSKPEANDQDLLRRQMRNIKAANKAAKAFLLLKERNTDLKIINEYEEGEARKITIVNIDSKGKRPKMEEREKIAI